MKHFVLVSVFAQLLAGCVEDTDPKPASAYASANVKRICWQDSPCYYQLRFSDVGGLGCDGDIDPPALYVRIRDSDLPIVAPPTTVIEFGPNRISDGRSANLFPVDEIEGTLTITHFDQAGAVGSLLVKGVERPFSAQLCVEQTLPDAWLGE